MRHLAEALSVLIYLIVYVAIGGGVFLINYGDPTAITLKLLVILIAWPFALIYWGMWYIFWGFVAVMCVSALIGIGKWVGDKKGWF